MASCFSAFGLKPRGKIAPLPLRILPRLERLLCCENLVPGCFPCYELGRVDVQTWPLWPVINTPQLSQDVGSQNKSDVKHPQA